ncbi:MAG TPA: cardiolipin synthase [Thermoanaerobaculia bacterium]|nr:cardiolipin synthase [Thermoanaerobaculia bacterium]
MKQSGRVAMAVVLAIGATLALILIVLNLSSGEKKIKHQIEPLYAIGDPQFLRAMGSLLGPPIVGGNRVATLINGDQIFPAMLDAIRGAKETIDFETYIYWSGEVGQQFADALSERARAGIRVHVLLDWVGSGKAKNEYLDEMREAGVEVEKYHPLRWYHLARINNRTHRKLLIVDGKVGFTGGVGIADKWSGNAQDPDHWRDSHFRLEGPAVAQMQAAFMDNWMKTQSKVLHGEDYFPRLEPVGSSGAQVFKSSPREGSESVRLMYLLSIASSRRRLLIANSYFVPDDLSVDAFVAARKRGVDVEIIVPGAKIDSELTRKASRSRWGDLLKAGVEIYEYRPTMYHCKVMVVDDLWVSVGSTNFDNRSFRLNDEANLNVFDNDFAREQAEVFERDRARSHRVTLSEWEHRPLPEKLLERLAGLLRSQL